MDFREANLEAQLDREQAVIWAENYYRKHGAWPLRRWRVEGSRVGNSRLLTEKEADRTSEQYGGQTILLIYDREIYRRRCKVAGRPCVLDMPRSRQVVLRMESD